MLLLLNLGEFQPGRLLIHAERVGTISEATSFLADLESAYTGLLRLEGTLSSLEGLSPRRLYWEFGPAFFLRMAEGDRLDPASVLPEFRLRIQKVRIESPGFWEFLGALNPLVQIREYLNDRHKRRQDREFREGAEADRLRLENELIQQTVFERETAVLREQLTLLRDVGFSDQEIRQLLWASAGRSLARLGAHQDSNMIENAE